MARSKTTNEAPKEEKVPKTIPGNVKEISQNWKKLRQNLVQNGGGISAKKSKKKQVEDSKINSVRGFIVENLKPKKKRKPKKEKITKNETVVEKKESNPQKTADPGDSMAELCKQKSFDGLTRCVAIDCEMVGTGFGGRNSSLARISIVNLYGHCIYDKFVKPMEDVTDYRTEVSGIRPENLKNAENFHVVQKEVYDIIKDRILIGHSIHYDLKVLYLSHPKNKIRDTSSFFMRFYNNRKPSLKRLTEDFLGVKIQDGEHSSVVDAQATMRLYTLFKKKWESSLAAKDKRRKSSKPTGTATIDTTEFVERLL